MTTTATDRASEVPAADSTDTLIEPTLKKATKYQGLLLAYFSSVAATIGGLSYLISKSDVLQTRWWFTIALLLTFLPLLATFFTLTFPAWQRRRREDRLRKWSIDGHESRPDYFRIGPYEDTEHDRQKYRRADQAHVQALNWIKASSQPLLFLTGASGSGKSSLLNAHVIPRLRYAQPATRVITLRSFDNPLVALREQLLTPDVVWQKPPKADENRPVLELLADACEYLQDKKRNERLLLVFDQFEELLILHDNASSNGQAEPAATDSEPLTAIAKTPVGGLDLLEYVQQFLYAIRSQPTAGLTVLLSLRSDYQGLLTRLDLPPLEQGRNWMQINAFSERASRDFLAGGFEAIGDNLLGRMMIEAAAVEETRGLIRPITLNMLGLVLGRLSGELSPGKERGGLLLADLRRVLAAPEIRDYARVILTPLLTAAGTKHPRAVAELQEQTGLDAHVIEGCLLQLYDRGLVRRLNRPLEIGRRQWEIAHDFVARLLTQFFHESERQFGRRIRQTVLPAAFGIWLISFVVLVPGYLHGIPHRAAERLRNDPLIRADVSRPDGRGWVVKISNNDISSLDQIGPLLRDLGDVEELDLSDCYALRNADGLQGLMHLQTLKLSNCLVLANMDGLQGLTSLQMLDLSGCNALTNVDEVQGLTSLRFVNLTKCNALTSVDGLQGLTSLQSLNISFCSALPNVDGLQGLTSLQSLNINVCDALPNVDGLQGLTSLRFLDLRACIVLLNVEGLKDLPKLETLDLRLCNQINDIRPLHRLKSLRRLGLSGDLSGAPDTISAQQIEELKKKLPEVEIITDNRENLSNP